MGEIYALDIETTGLSRFKDRVICIGIYNPSESHCFFHIKDFQDWLKENKEAEFIAHRGAFDVNFLRQHGCDVFNNWVYDTRSIASILIPRPRQAEGQKNILGLENLGIVLLDHAPYKLDRTQMERYSRDEIREYCLADCKLTYELFFYLFDKIPEKSWGFVERWIMPATKFCSELEWNGVGINEPGLKHYQNEIQKQRDVIHSELQAMAATAITFYHEMQVQEVSRLYKEMYEKAKIKTKDQTKCLKRYALLESAAVSRLEPFNWNSSTQLKWLLKDYYCLDIRSEREDKETTDEAMLKTLDHPVAKKLCDYRELEKLCSTCIPALIDNSEDSYVYASYHVGGTRTGRLSSSGPNLQQIPKGPIRSFVRGTGENVLVTIDYAQIEVRIIAELAKEEELINAFNNKIDPYSIIAQKLLQIDCPVKEIKERFKRERDVSKTAGLSILYGTGPAKLQEVLRKELGRNYSVTECRGFIETYRNSLPGVKNLRKKLDRELANGKTSYNLLGRPFNIDSNDDIYMTGLNTLVQGSASDLVIYSQTKFVLPALKELGVDFKHRMLIHDEVVIELPASEAELLVNDIIVPKMTVEVAKDLNLRVPLDVEYTIRREWAKP